MRDRPFMLFTLLMMGYWFVSVQINISFPLFIVRLTGSADGIGIMFALSAAMTILFQYPVIRWLEKHMSTGQILVVGIAIMAVGMLGIAIVGNYLQFLGMVALFSFGALLTRPTQQTITAGLADKRALGTFLGFNSLALAIGGGLGNVAGGWLFDVSRRATLSILPWLTFGSLAIITAIALHLFLSGRDIAFVPVRN